MIIQHSRDGRWEPGYQDPGVRIVVDGQLREAPASLGSWYGDAWDATGGRLVDAAQQLPEAFKWAAGKVCNAADNDTLVKNIIYLRVASLVPGPQQPALLATLATYETTARACGLLIPPPAPLPPGSGTAAKAAWAQQLLVHNSSLYSPPKPVAGSAGSGFISPSSAISPWYKRGTTYAAVGGVLAAVGAGWFFAKRR